MVVQGNVAGQPVSSEGACVVVVVAIVVVVEEPFSTQLKPTLQVFTLAR